MAAEISALEARAAPARSGRRPGPPLYILLPAIFVAVAALSPVAYLVLRLSDAGGRSLDLILQESTARTLLRSVLLAAVVSSGAVALSLPLAWLTVRTDLPLRRLWAIVTALPLVIPSYVGAFTVIEALGPKGLFQRALEGPLGIDRLPEIYGLSGA